MTVGNRNLLGSLIDKVVVGVYVLYLLQLPYAALYYRIVLINTDVKCIPDVLNIVMEKVLMGL